MTIPHVDVKAQYAPLIEELKDRLGAVVDSGRFILGPEVRAFEEEAASLPRRPRRRRRRERDGRARPRPRRAGRRAGRRGDLSRRSRSSPRRRPYPRRGATPVFCDIDADHPEPRSCRRRRPSHRADEGDPRRAPLRPSRGARRAARRRADRRGRRAGLRRELGGVRAGAVGVAATFSFFPTKNLFGLGDGGLVASRERRGRRPRARPALPRVARQGALRGDRLQLPPRRAPGGRAEALPRPCRPLERASGARLPRATRSSASASSSSCPRTTLATSTTCSSCARPSETGSPRRSGTAGIGCATYYTTPLHLQPVYESLGGRPGSLPETERASRETIALPLWAGISEAQQEQVVATIRSAVGVGANA